jgi:hypothetical protein
MFGPEYESVEFTSNRGMATVIRTLLGGTSEQLTTRRPDVVVLPDRSISCYSSDRFNASGEVDGIKKVLIVELKRGGFDIGTAELRQGEDYALELQKANLVNEGTEIIVYVLGAKVSDKSNQERMVGHTIKVIPMAYETILKRAQARTFNLQRKLTMVEALPPSDEDVEAVAAISLLESGD